MKLDSKPLSTYQAIWAQAKRNGAIQDFDTLPAQNWTWPSDTFLQRRLAELRKRNPNKINERPDPELQKIQS